MKKGFTLLELLIVIGILAVLSTTIVLVINPTELLAKARDSSRISDLNALRNAIALFIVKKPEEFIGENDQTYSHVQGIQCSTGQGSSATTQLIDGSGWIPIDFTKMSGFTSLSNLPIDPVSNKDKGLYYVYTVDSLGKTFKLTANMESEYYSEGGSGDVTSKDGGNIDSLYELGTNLSLAPISLNTNCFESFASGGPPVGWQCGDNITFTYKGSSVTYGTVESQGKCWMDRNLGASRVAISSTDTNAYGDLFQWGRLDDGHQSRTSGTTSTRSSSDTPGHSNFILHSSSPNDWRNPQNNNLWQGVDGINNPCPPGWRIPTAVEWQTELNSWVSKNNNGAYASPLKLTMGGYRDYSTGGVSAAGSRGRYRSSTISGTSAEHLGFDSSSASMNAFGRAYGQSVRCIKN